MGSDTKRISLFPGFEISSEDVFIDVGCGSGNDCGSAARVGADVIAVDIVADHVAAATSAVEGVGARSYRGIVTDCDPIPLPDATATKVLCFEVMEHVADPVKFMKELVRIAKPGAQFALSVPASSAESLMKILAPQSYFEPPGHVRIFERQQFEDLIRSAGLQIDRSEGVGFESTIWWTLRMACGTSHLPGFTEAPPRILASWEETFRELERTPLGPKIIAALDDLLPKSYRVTAHKPVAAPRPHFSFWKRALAR